MATCRYRILFQLAFCTVILFADIWAESSLADITSTRTQHFVAHDAAAGDLFGFAVATDGRWLTVGAKFADTFAREDGGAVYVYRMLTDEQWALVQKLVPLLGGLVDEFGESVALWHNHLVVGARSALNANGSRSGVAYVFNRTMPGHGSFQGRMVGHRGRPIITDRIQKFRGGVHLSLWRHKTLITVCTKLNQGREKNILLKGRALFYPMPTPVDGGFWEYWGINGAPFIFSYLFLQISTVM